MHLSDLQGVKLAVIKLAAHWGKPTGRKITQKANVIREKHLSELRTWVDKVLLTLFYGSGDIPIREQTCAGTEMKREA